MQRIIMTKSLLVMLLLLTSCASAEEKRIQKLVELQALQNNYRINCTRYGFEENTDSFKNCMMLEEHNYNLKLAQEKQAEAEWYRGFAQFNAQYNKPYQAQFYPMQIQRQQNHSFNCTSNAIGNNISTNCY